MVDHSRMKLGKGPVVRKAKTIKLARILRTGLVAPAKSDYLGPVTDFGMMENDTVGDCTEAAKGHAIQVWTFNATGRMVTVSDSDVLAEYEKNSGYQPGNESTDSGENELTTLTAWRKNGFAGHKLEAFASVPAQDVHEISLAIWLFGGAYIGVELPVTAQSQDTWDVVDTDSGDADPGSWGGHAVFMPWYNFTVPSERMYKVISWGKVLGMTDAFRAKYCSEVYALLSKEWLQASGMAINGVDWATLDKELAEVTA
jgi:hypothetical protein